MTNDEMTRVLGRLTAGFDKRLSDDTYTIWREELEPLDFSPAYAAARELVKTSRFFPSIAEMLDAYRDHHHRQAGPRLHVVCPHCDDGWVFITGRDVTRCDHCNRTETA